MSIQPDHHDIARRRAAARRTAAIVALAAVAVYVLFWVGGVLSR